MKITDKIKKQFIAVRFNKEIMPKLKLSKEEKIKFEKAIKTECITKTKME